MDKNRIEAMRVLAQNLKREGQTSRHDCVIELCDEVERLERELAEARGLLRNWQERCVTPMAAPDNTAHLFHYVAPIARITVQDGMAVGASLYSPGLPDGSHDLYPACFPFSAADDHTANAGKIVETAQHSKGMHPNCTYPCEICDAEEDQAHQTTVPLFSCCEFKGDPPSGHKSWYDWANTRPLADVTIAAWTATEDSSAVVTESLTAGLPAEPPANPYSIITKILADLCDQDGNVRGLDDDKIVLDVATIRGVLEGNLCFPPTKDS